MCEILQLACQASAPGLPDMAYSLNARSYLSSHARAVSEKECACFTHILFKKQQFAKHVWLCLHALVEVFLCRCGMDCFRFQVDFAHKLVSADCYSICCHASCQWVLTAHGWNRYCSQPAFFWWPLIWELDDPPPIHSLTYTHAILSFWLHSKVVLCKDIMACCGFSIPAFVFSFNNMFYCISTLIYICIFNWISTIC